MSAVIKYLKRNQKTHLNQLLELLAIPSVSTDVKRKPAMKKAAAWMQKRLKAVGCTTAKIHDTRSCTASGSAQKDARRSWFTATTMCSPSIR